jgi:hypothetical protein
MSKKNEKLDPNQKRLPFGDRVEAYLKEKAQILDTIYAARPAKHIENYDEACIELAAAIKKAIRQSGMSREAAVEGINTYFGWTEGSAKKLSIHMFNHYLSKPVQYPIPGALIYAIQHVTGSLEPCRSFAEIEDGDVISKGEKDELLFGKADMLASEVGKIKKELRKRMSQF